MAAHKYRPCKRCGAEKGDPSLRWHAWYCAPCGLAARAEYLDKRFPWWCRQCPQPWSCATCKEKRRERLMESVRNRKPRSDASGYFRPHDAERWWQYKSHALVQNAIKRGFLPSLKEGNYACVDCGDQALEYDHRDYGRPFDVEPVCRSCNKKRGTAKWPTADQFDFRLRA